MICITSDGRERMEKWRSYAPFRFYKEDFQWMIDNASNNFGCNFGPVRFLHGKDLMINPLPPDIEINIDHGYPFCWLSRHGRAPRNTRKGEYFLTQINNRLFIIEILTGINEGTHRQGRLFRIVVRTRISRINLMSVPEAQP